MSDQIKTTEEKLRESVIELIDALRPHLQPIADALGDALDRCWSFTVHVCNHHVVLATIMVLYLVYLALNIAAIIARHSL